jgi:hypothetical protein
MSPRLIPAAELGVEGHLFRLQHGRPPREGEIQNDEELVEAGYQKPPPEPWTPGPDGPTAAELIEDPIAAARRELRGYEVELEYALKGGQVAGDQSPNRAARFRDRIAELRAQIAAADEAA